MFGKRKIAALVAEFLGTGILTLLVLSVQRSTIGVPFFVALAAGLTVTVMVFALGGVSGAHLNPAITIGLWTARKISTLSAVLYVIAQMLGAWATYYLYTYLVNSKLQPIGGHFTSRILIAEAIGTFIFAFGWAAAVYQGFSRAVSSSLTGLAYTIGIVAASAASIGLANPALALGVRAWVLLTYVLGPVLGAIIGVNLYGLLFATPEALVAAEVSGASVATQAVVVDQEAVAPKRTRATTRTTGSRAKRSSGTAGAATRRRTTTTRRAATGARRRNG
jgi:glycerol uptake facilitator-like aquaporin